VATLSLQTQELNHQTHHLLRRGVLGGLRGAKCSRRSERSMSAHAASQLRSPISAPPVLTSKLRINRGKSGSGQSNSGGVY
jgi:hypothetical protein